MKPEDIDRLLASEPPIAPSAGFLASVMDAVERDARALPPLRFPWLRALPGLLAAGVALVGVIGHGAGLWGDPATLVAMDDLPGRTAALVAAFELEWIALASTVTLLALLFSTRLVRRGTHA